MGQVGPRSAPKSVPRGRPPPGRSTSALGTGCGSGFRSSASAQFFPYMKRGAPGRTHFAALFSGVAALTVTFQGQEPRSPPSLAAVCPRCLTREAPCRVAPTPPGVDRPHDIGAVTLDRARGQRSSRRRGPGPHEFIPSQPACRSCLLKGSCPTERRFEVFRWGPGWGSPSFLLTAIFPEDRTPRV